VLNRRPERAEPEDPHFRGGEGGVVVFRSALHIAEQTTRSYRRKGLHWSFLRAQLFVRFVPVTRLFRSTAQDHTRCDTCTDQVHDQIGPGTGPCLRDYEQSFFQSGMLCVLPASYRS
jgi:hypothetical protein